MIFHSTIKLLNNIRFSSRKKILRGPNKVRLRVPQTQARTQKKPLVSLKQFRRKKLFLSLVPDVPEHTLSLYGGKVVTARLVDKSKHTRSDLTCVNLREEDMQQTSLALSSALTAVDDDTTIYLRAHGSHGSSAFSSDDIGGKKSFLEADGFAEFLHKNLSMNLTQIRIKLYSCASKASGQALFDKLTTLRPDCKITVICYAKTVISRSFPARFTVETERGEKHKLHKEKVIYQYTKKTGKVGPIIYNYAQKTAEAYTLLKHRVYHAKWSADKKLHFYKAIKLLSFKDLFKGLLSCYSLPDRENNLKALVADLKILSENQTGFQKLYFAVLTALWLKDKTSLAMGTTKFDIDLILNLISKQDFTEQDAFDFLFAINFIEQAELRLVFFDKQACHNFVYVLNFLQKQKQSYHMHSLRILEDLVCGDILIRLELIRKSSGYLQVMNFNTLENIVLIINQLSSQDQAEKILRRMYHHGLATFFSSIHKYRHKDCHIIFLLRSSLKPQYKAVIIQYYLTEIQKFKHLKFEESSASDVLFITHMFRCLPVIFDNLPKHISALDVYLSFNPYFLTRILFRDKSAVSKMLQILNIEQLQGIAEYLGEEEFTRLLQKHQFNATKNKYTEDFLRRDDSINTENHSVEKKIHLKETPYRKQILKEIILTEIGKKKPSLLFLNGSSLARKSEESNPKTQQKKQNNYCGDGVKKPHPNEEIELLISNYLNL